MQTEVDEDQRERRRNDADHINAYLKADASSPAPGDDIGSHVGKAVGLVGMAFVGVSFLGDYLSQNVAGLICLVGAGVAAAIDHRSRSAANERVYRRELSLRQDLERN